MSAPPEWAGGAGGGGAAHWALRALWREIAEFRFEFDAREVQGAERSGAIPYHLASAQLFADAMRLDGGGIPFHVSRTFQAYNPAYVAWYALQQLANTQRGDTPDAGARQRFATQIAWLRDHAVRRPDGAAVWHYGFDWREGEALLRAPWISAMAQGLAMSALVRAHRLSPAPALLELAVAAARPFELPIDQGGVRSAAKGGVAYEEYPAHPEPRVLDGFLFALLGLYDVALETGDARLRGLFDQGVEGLVGELPLWDFRGKWSWYGRRQYLCPPHYHGINRALLLAVANASNRAELAEVAAAWDPRGLGVLDRVQLYLTFVITKQGSRVRDRLVARRLAHGRDG